MSNGIRANTADLEFFQLLKKSGCNFVGIGMESGDDQVLKDIKKRLEKKKLLKVLEYANECGVGTAVNFIIGHPTETYESAINTLNFAESLPASYVNIYGLIPLKGTEAYSQLVEMEKSGNARFFMKFDEYVNSYTGQNSRSFYETDSFSIEQKNIILEKGRDLTNKKAMCFRFGKIFGAILFFISKNRYIYNIFSRIRSSQIGEKIYLSIRNE